MWNASHELFKNSFRIFLFRHIVRKSHLTLDDLAGSKLCEETNEAAKTMHLELAEINALLLAVEKISVNLQQEAQWSIFNFAAQDWGRFLKRAFFVNTMNVIIKI